MSYSMQETFGLSTQGFEMEFGFDGAVVGGISMLRMSGWVGWEFDWSGRNWVLDGGNLKELVVGGGSGAGVELVWSGE